MTDTLVTGFTPFDGRDINASWVAARSLADRARTLEVPVIWGQPLMLLTPLCIADCPETIIAMGEGRPGWFDIETLARNERAEREDNDGALPGGIPIEPGGAERFDASVDAAAVQGALLAAGYPTRLSKDAGGFLCEEMLYSLERLRQQFDRLTNVTFVHLPPYGTNVRVAGASRRCDDALLESFAATLFETITGAAPALEKMDNA